MTLTQRGLAVAALLLTLTFAACDSPTGTSGGPPIVIGDTWRNVDLAGHTIFFQSPDDDRASGVLVGTEESHPTFGTSPVGGHWSNGRIEITIARQGELPKFVAHFSAPRPTRLEFVSSTPGHPSFTLEQGL